MKLIPGGALESPLFASLLRRLTKTRAGEELSPGVTIGAYRIVEPLGRGGMAVVYAAERADGEFEQKVALKVIASDRESPELRELLRRERQFLAALNHPNIARLLDGGTTQDGCSWFAMELVYGTRIDHFVRDRRWPLEKRLRLFLQICDAVQFAHARLLIHRDLKPSNILVTDDGQTKLLDFGIAISSGGEQTPLFAMTPQFASPEQRRNETITTASDIWQLGNLLELLVEKNRGADLSAIIGCAKNPAVEARYGSAGELAAEVSRFLERRPVVARGAGLIYRASLFFARHRRSSTIVALVTLGAIFLAIQFTYRLARERDRASKEAERANMARSFVVELFQRADPSAPSGGALDVRQFLETGVERARADLGAQPDLRAELLQTIGRIYVARGEPRLAQPLFDEALQHLRDEDPLALAEALRDHGTALLESSSPLAALGSLTRSASSFERAGSIGQRQLPATLSLLALAQLGSGRVADALATQRRAAELADREYGPKSVESAQSLQNLAIILLEAGEHAERRIVAEESWQILRARRGLMHPETLRAQQLYTSILLETGRTAEARGLLEESAQAQRMLYQARGAIYASAIRALGKLNAIEGDHRRAIEYYREAEALYQASIDVDSLAIAWTLSALGDSHEILGEFDLALDAYERSLDIRRRRSAPDHLTIAHALDACSRQWSRLGFGARAEALSRESLDIRSATLPPSSPDLAKSLLPLGAAYWVLGERDEARAAWDRALELLQHDPNRVRPARDYVASMIKSY